MSGLPPIQTYKAYEGALATLRLAVAMESLHTPDRLEELKAHLGGLPLEYPDFAAIHATVAGNDNN